MKTRKVFLILAALGAADFSVLADKVAFEGVPPPVQQAIRYRSGRQPIEDIDRDVRNGQITYEASWKNPGGTQQELLVSEQGRILRDVVGGVGPSTGLANQNLTLINKTGVGLTETPEAVQIAISNRLLNAPVDSIQRGIWNGQNIYEITYHDNGQLKTYQVAETGRPIVGERPATSSQPRYGTEKANLPLSGGVKMGFNEAPQSVQRTVTQVANGAQIEDFERGQWNGRYVYEAAFKHNGENVELQVFDDGTVVTKAPPGTVAANSFAGGWLPRYANMAAANVRLLGNRKVTLTEAPATVQETINHYTQGVPLQDFQRGLWNGWVVYGAAFNRNGQRVEVQILEDGSILTTAPGSAVGGPPTSVSGSAQP